MYQGQGSNILQSFCRLAYSLIFLFCISSNCSSQKYISLPYSQVSTIGEAEVSIYLIDEQRYLTKPTLDGECSPCQIELRFNDFFLSRQIRPFVIEGSTQVIQADDNKLQLESLNLQYTENTHVFTVKSNLQTVHTLSVFSDSETSLSFYTITEEAFRDLITGYNIAYIDKFNTISTLFIGVLLILSLLSIVNYFVTGRTEFVHYGLYILVMAFFFLAPSIPDLFFEAKKYTVLDKISMKSNIRAISQPLSYIFYFLFIRFFLQTEKDYPRLDILLRIVILVSCVVTLAICFGIYFELNLFSQLVFTFYRILLALASLILIIYTLIHAKDIYAYIIIASSIVLVAGSLISWITTLNSTSFLGIVPIGWFMLATFIELLLFSFGLALKTKDIENQKENYAQLLLQNEQQQLKSEKERSLMLNSILEDKTMQIEEEITARLKNEYLLKVKELEQEALFAQMNPHFLFNSLNSLKSHILKDNPRKAAHYLDKLAIFFRMVLSQARRQQTTIEQELDFIKHYLDLENYRLSEKVELAIVSNYLDEIESVMIPTMLLQPLVENSIIHGFKRDQENKKISIHLNVEGDFLEITVRDNGSGLQKKPENIRPSHLRSMSTKINQERLNIKYNKASTMTISNRESNGKPVGVDAVIRIPLS